MINTSSKENLFKQKVTNGCELFDEYILLFNSFRREFRLQPLVVDAELQSISVKRAIEISRPDNFSHEGIRQYNLGENICRLAYESDSNERLLSVWVGSQGHLENIVNPNYTRTGFARYGKYAVQVFK